MATQPSEEHQISNHAEPATDIENVCVRVGSTPPESEGASDIENVCVSVGSTPPESEGASETSEGEVDERYYRPLLQAAFRGDWESAKRFFEQDSTSKTAKITSRSETVLHIAAWSVQDQFVENLVELLSPNRELLETVDCDGRTALHIAVLCGRIRMVKVLVRGNPKLTQLQDKRGWTPLEISAADASRHKEIAWFLAENTTYDGPSHPLSSPSAFDTISNLTVNGHPDIALYLVRRNPYLIIVKGYGGLSILDTLARDESHFRSGTRLSVLEAFIYKCIPVDLKNEPIDKNSDRALQYLSRTLWNAAKIAVPIIKRIHEMKLRHVAAIELAKKVCIAISHLTSTEIANYLQENHALGQATVRGINEIVKLCFQFFPELIWISPRDKWGTRLTTRAVEFRQERTLNLFLKESSTNKLSIVPALTLRESKQMMDAAVVYTAKGYYLSFDTVTNVAGAAFQLQREIQWYKAVESWSAHVVASNRYDLKTYWNKFVENHKDLLERGEKWAKDTANSCMIVSTLIATVLFAAAFTMPGGNNNNTGVPLLLAQDSFLVFAISDALGLFSSVTAVLLFLAILTSRYEAQDFLESLPKKIIMGLCFLFLSLAFMLVAFAAALTVMLDKRLEWVLIPITLLASLPMAFFARLQLPLLFQMIKSTYGPSIFRAESIWDGVNYTEQEQ